uniref:Uncharacterized protein n=1 Tax=Opuntia streptacantha TaxID=393608 RepID=A0A7C9EVQ4_OPUST
MERCNRADAQRCNHFLQQFPLWNGDLENLIDPVAPLLHSAVRVREKGAGWIRAEQGSCFYSANHTRDQEILKDFLGLQYVIITFRLICCETVSKNWPEWC